MSSKDVPKMMVNILWSKSQKKVLYLEAGKDFVDLLLSLLRMPVANLLKLLDDASMLNKTSLPAISNVYSSANEMQDSLLQVDRSTFLNPNGKLKLLLDVAEQPAMPMPLFTCPNMHNYYSVSKNVLCPSVNDYRYRGHGQHTLSTRVSFKKPPSADATTYYRCSCGSYCTDVDYCCSGSKTQLTQLDANGDTMETSTPTIDHQASGFVKENVTFMVTDELHFYPSSTIRSIALLNKLGVANMGDLESSEAAVTYAEALAMVKASLSSSSVLNQVFGTAAGNASPRTRRQRHNSAVA